MNFRQADGDDTKICCFCGQTTCTLDPLTGPTCNNFKTFAKEAKSQNLRAKKLGDAIKFVGQCAAIQNGPYGKFKKTAIYAAKKAGVRRTQRVLYSLLCRETNSGGWWMRSLPGIDPHAARSTGVSGGWIDGPPTRAWKPAPPSPCKEDSSSEYEMILSASESLDTLQLPFDEEDGHTESSTATSAVSNPAHLYAPKCDRSDVKAQKPGSKAILQHALLHPRCNPHSACSLGQCASIAPKRKIPVIGALHNFTPPLDARCIAAPHYDSELEDRRVNANHNRVRRCTATATNSHEFGVSNSTTYLKQAREASCQQCPSTQVLAMTTQPAHQSGNVFSTPRMTGLRDSCSTCPSRPTVRWPSKNRRSMQPNLRMRIFAVSACPHRKQPGQNYVGYAAFARLTEHYERFDCIPTLRLQEH